LAAPLISEQLRNFGTAPAPGGAWELLGLLQNGYPEGFLLAPPLGQFLNRCSRALPPPAFRVRASGRPLEVLPGGNGQSLAGRTGRRGVCWHLPDGIRFLFLARSVFAVAGLGELPVPGSVNPLQQGFPIRQLLQPQPHIFFELNKIYRCPGLWFVLRGSTFQSCPPPSFSGRRELVSKQRNHTWSVSTFRLVGVEHLLEVASPDSLLGLNRFLCYYVILHRYKHHVSHSVTGPPIISSAAPC